MKALPILIAKVTYRDRANQIEDLCNVVVHEKNDVDLDRGKGVLKDPNHEGEQITGYNGDQAKDKDYWMLSYSLIVNSSVPVTFLPSILCLNYDKGCQKMYMKLEGY